MSKKERSPAIQFYFRQFAGDEHVMALDLDAVGAHILLMCAAGASNRGYKLPSDERMIRNIIRNPSDLDWQRIKCQLLSGAWKISKDGSWWEQRGMRRSILKRKVFIESQSRKGKAGMEARWKDNRGYDSAITQHNSSSSSSSSTAIQKREERSAPPPDQILNVETVKAQIQQRREALSARIENSAERRRRLNQEAIDAAV